LTSLERSWYRPFGWSLLLWPLSLLFALLSMLRRWLFRWGVSAVHKLPVPVIVVGNITVGGTGKTPITLWLCDYLRQQGLKPGIISRGYGVKLTAPRLVLATDSAEHSGDEPLLLAQRSGCPVAIFPDRAAAARLLLAQTDCNIIISDDGLQHYALARDLEIILLDGARGVGNGCLLPAGPLREGCWRLASADLVLVNSQPHPLSPYTFQLQPQSPCCLLDSRQQLSNGSAVSLVSGIGNPARFAATVQQLGYPVKQQHWFADHYAFAAADFTEIEAPVLMTEKDAVKCRPFARPDWFYLPVQAVLPAQAVSLLAAKLNQIRSHYGL
jgi:tetraacyldisaccharide 4'-kinase